MKCPRCEKEGLKSYYYLSSGGGSTCAGWIPFFDEDGKYHSHDPNTTQSESHCSNGHKFIHKYMSKCCEEYPGKDETIDVTGDNL